MYGQPGFTFSKFARSKMVAPIGRIIGSQTGAEFLFSDLASCLSAMVNGVIKDSHQHTTEGQKRDTYSTPLLLFRVLGIDDAWCAHLVATMCPTFVLQWRDGDILYFLESY